MKNLPFIKTFGTLCILLVSIISVSGNIYAEKLADGVWTQSDSPGTTYINFTNGSTPLNNDYYIVLTFPQITPIDVTGTNARITNESAPTRTNNYAGNQITLKLNSPISANQEISVTMTNALAAINRGLIIGDSVSINTYNDSDEIIDQALAYLVVQGTEISARVPRDMDNDGIYNWWELEYGLDPTNPIDAALDYDNDNLTNLQEYIYGTNPYKKDTDGDNLNDYDEIFKYLTNPTHSHVPDDLDRDGMPNWWEIQYKLDYTDSTDASEDPDEDGLTNLKEFTFNTNPNKYDTDEDGINDYEEVFKYLSNPLDADTDGDGISDYDEIFTYNTNLVAYDSDFDGLNDYEEIFTYKTNPLIWDTDDGGMSDRDEINNGSNPNFKDDDYRFVWTMYYGKSPNDLYNVMDNVKINMFQGMNLTFEAAPTSDVRTVAVNYNNKGFSSEKEFIKLNLLSPDRPGLYEIEITLTLKTGKIIKMTRFLEVKPRGHIIKKADGQLNSVYNKLDFFKQEPVENAKIEVFIFNNFTNELELFKSEYFDHANPSYTDAKGTYYLALHPGTYLIKISKPELGTKEILYNTDKYVVYSEDIHITYNYDAIIWGGIFTGIFILIWNTINTIAHIKYWLSTRIEKKVKSHKAY